jgi:hypothetical protein
MPIICQPPLPPRPRLPPLCPNPKCSPGPPFLLGRPHLPFRRELAPSAAHYLPSRPRADSIPFRDASCSVDPSVVSLLTLPPAFCLGHQHRRQRRLAAGVHGVGVAGAVRGGAPQDGVREAGARAAPARDGHVEQRAVQGRQRQRPRHQRVHRQHQAGGDKGECSSLLLLFSFFLAYTCCPLL